MERLLHLIWLGFKNLSVHRLRSILTALGIMLGVAAAIAALAVGEAARFKAVQQIQDLGATNLIVRSIKPKEDNKTTNKNQETLSYGLTISDMERLAATIPTIVSVTPLREFRKEVRYLDRVLEARVVSVMPEFLTMNRLHLSRGRFIAELDNERFRNVVVLGAETAEILFPVEDPIGRSVHIGENHDYIVVGVTESRAPSAGIGGSLAGQDFNRDVYIPFATDQVRFGKYLVTIRPGHFQSEQLEISQLTIAVDDMAHVKRTGEVVQGVLDQYHPQKDTAVTVPLDLLEKAEQTQWTFTIVLGLIGLIALIVGGVGVMNIMLATVTERTREIGVRRALGAKRRDIGLQFLIETVLLANIAGLLGIAVGIGASYGIVWFFSFPLIIQPWSPLVAFAVSGIVGLLSGMYPAWRAARMDPIEALRHE